MKSSMQTINYTIIPKDLFAHLFEVTLAVKSPDPSGQIFSLPAWIPGSYMIREFARNIVQIGAESKGKKVKLKKLDKHTWQAAPCDGVLTLCYEVYAWDLSVRAAHLDCNFQNTIKRIQKRKLNNQRQASAQGIDAGFFIERHHFLVLLRFPRISQADAFILFVNRLQTRLQCLHPLGGFQLRDFERE